MKRFLTYVAFCIIAASVAFAQKPGELVKRKGNQEIRKGAKANQYTANVFSSPQWDDNGAPLVKYDDNEKITIARGRWVRFSPDAATAKLTVKRTVGNTSVKEFYTVPSSAMTTLSWTVQSNAPGLRFEKGELTFLDTLGEPIVTTPPPVAWDASKATVPITVDYVKGVLSYTIQAGEWVYPITVDPSIYVTDTDATTGRLGARDAADYATARNSTTASLSADNTAMQVGVNYTGNFDVWRTPLSYDTSSLDDAAVIDSVYVKLVLLGETGASADSTYLVEGTFTGTIDAAWFNDFTGWAASGEYTITKLTPGIINTAPAVGDTVTISLNTSGIALISKTGTTKFMMIGETDRAGTGGTPRTDVTYEDDSTYLTILYNIPSGTRSTPYDKTPNTLWLNGAAVPLWRP